MEALTLPLASWLASFLECRGLHHPDGRPLFAYKATADEYQQLVELLTKTPRSETQSTRYFQAWLLFAAEWWKREYAGGAWRWAPVFDALHRPIPEYAQVQRAVMEGRRAWHLTGALADGKKYIGQVAVNGGLPMRLLEGAQGGLSRILRMVLEDAVIFSLNRAQIYACCFALKIDPGRMQYNTHQLARPAEPLPRPPTKPPATEPLPSAAKVGPRRLNPGTTHNWTPNASSPASTAVWPTPASPTMKTNASRPAPISRASSTVSAAVSHPAQRATETIKPRGGTSTW